MKYNHQTCVSALISAGTLMLASKALCEDLADALQTKAEADTTVLALETELQAKLIDPSQAPEEYATVETDDDDDDDEVPAIISEMEAQLVQVNEVAEKLKNLEAGEFREAELADWNANYEVIKDLLGQLLGQESDKGISDDLAPILEGIRKQFRLETPDVTQG